MRAVRKFFTHHWWVGITLTLLLTAAWALGAFTSFENWLYDQRAARFQYFLKPPSDRIVYLDIDDSVLEAIAIDEKTSWPWPRAILGEMIDEIAGAGPAAIALDIILKEPQRPEIIDRGDGQYATVDHDAVLRDAIARTQATLVPVSVQFSSGDATLQDAIDQVMERNPDADDARVVALVMKEAGGGDELAVRSVTPQVRARRAVRRLLITRRYEPVTQGQIYLAPLRGLVEASAMTGFVDYPPQGDARLRTVPLLVNTPDGVVPQMGLALACRLLKIDPNIITWDKNSVRLGDRVIPVGTRYSSAVGAELATVFHIPWFGPADWRQMYGPAFAQHVSLTEVWNIVRARRLMERNAARADEAIAVIVAIAGEPSGIDRPTSGADRAQRAHYAEAVLRGSAEMIDLVRQSPADALDDVSRSFLKAAEELPKLLEENDRHAGYLATARAALREKLNDKGVLVGWISSGAVADVKPTSLHDACPGVIAHGVVANGILTGEMWRALPNWLAMLVMLVAGVVAIPISARFSPSGGVLALMGILLLWVLLNGVVLFDRFNLLLPAGGPMVACGVVYGTGTIVRAINERMERRRIRSRFSNYVDPQLVAYVEAHPELSTFEGQVREMTVVFNDLANFTPLTRKLGQRTIPLLNEFFGDMVPVIRAHNGYVNKFLGDGIMFFYNAPQLNPNHAADAVATILDLQTQLRKFNQRLAEQGLPVIGLRAGVSTGEMVVGDAGGRGASDYTVLGDAVNLGARLESANKALDSQSLITDRTVELAGDGFLYRPMGRLVVVGRDVAVECHEVLARREEATGEQRELAEMTRAVVTAFQAGNFKEALDAVDRYEQRWGVSKFGALYRNRSEYHRDHADVAFDGSIVLADK